jgi:tripartite ATP-independent transporter DctM subunit
MDWLGPFVVIIGGLLILMSLGMPIAFGFLAVNVVGAYLYWGGGVGLNQLMLSIQDSVASFSILPVPLFVLMGELLFRSGLAGKLIDILDQWIGRVPGRLSLMAVGGGTLFATLTGSGSAATALLGKILVPNMASRGYRLPMSIGPIMGSGGLAIMIPPSSLGVLLAATADIPVGPFLLAITVPGFIMAAAYAVYVIVRAYLQPHLAPPYDSPAVPLSKKIANTVIYVLPLAFIIFLVTGLMFMGVATPSESAALGVVGALCMTWLYKTLSWSMLLDCLRSTLMTSIMILMILTGSNAFSQLLAFTGATSGLIDLATQSNLSPIVIVIIMQLVLLVLGTFMESLAMIMLTAPIYFPIISALGLSPLWFGAIMLLNMEIASLSPPFGFILFVSKAVSPKGTTMMDIYKASVPFLLINSAIMLLMIMFPQTVLWLPSLLR